jgi:hypothetical protein
MKDFGFALGMLMLGLIVTPAVASARGTSSTEQPQSPTCHKEFAIGTRPLTGEIYGRGAYHTARVYGQFCPDEQYSRHVTS